VAFGAVERDRESAGAADRPADPANALRTAAETSDSSGSGYDELLGRGGIDIVCFSYLVAPTMLALDRELHPDAGAEIVSTGQVLNGDGPLVAAFASGFGLAAALEANAVGDDEAGRSLRAFLDRNGVAHGVQATEPHTPAAFVLSHPNGSREWLVEFDPIRKSLASCEFNLLREARLAYVDCYAALEEAATRALRAAASAEVSVYANLGGDEPSSSLAAALADSRPAVVQDRFDETRPREALAHARHLRDRFAAAVAVVTLGAKGAVAVGKEGEAQAPARAVEVEHANGAGAAFTAGMIYSERAGLSLADALVFACGCGGLQCTKDRKESPSAENVYAFIEATQPRR
jgi:sugar/nucleoside kinase (ribokinase family)